eukprot:8576390-Pyramimonas_sp.AAC.2
MSRSMCNRDLLDVLGKPVDARLDCIDPLERSCRNTFRHGPRSSVREKRIESGRRSSISKKGGGFTFDRPRTMASRAL